MASVKFAKTGLRRATRSKQLEADADRDSKFHAILSSNPKALYKSIKSSKSISSFNIQKLNVGNKVYSGGNVPDGFFDSMSALKAPDMSTIHETLSYKSVLSDYDHILKICQAGLKIP